MATIYLNTETRNYCELNWEKAVTVVKESNHPLFTRVSENAWVLILSFLGQEAPNMRRVCAFFLRHEFRPIYESSPIFIDSEVSKTDFGRYFNFLPPAKNIKTNTSVYLKPSETNDWKSSFNPSESQCIIHFMPKLKGLSTLLLEGDYEFIADYNGKFRHQVVLKIVSYEEVPRWDVIKRFKALQELRCYLQREAYFGGLPNKGELASLRSFHLHAYKANNLPLYLDDVSCILKAMPNLESLRIEIDPIRQTSGGLTLEPLALKYLKKIEIIGFQDLKSLDWMTMLSAAPHIRELKLLRCTNQTLVEVFETLNADELPFLETIDLNDTLMTPLACKALMAAAPKLNQKWLFNMPFSLS